MIVDVEELVIVRAVRARVVPGVGSGGKVVGDDGLGARFELLGGAYGRMVSGFRVEMLWCGCGRSS